VELELVQEHELLESGGELTAEDAAENANGQEETWRCSDPSGAIERESASRDNAVNMGMMLKVLILTEHGGQAPMVLGKGMASGR
jgi:hypothetical protein